MNDTTQQLVFGILVPLAVVGAVVAMPRLDRFKWRVPLALAIPVVLAFLADRWGGPADAWHDAVYVPAAGAVVGILMAFPPRSRRWRATLVVALGALAMIAIWPVFRDEPWWLRLLPALAIIGMMIGLEPLAARRPGPGFAIPVALAVATSAAIVLISGFMKLTVPYAALAVGLAARAAVALWRRPFSLADGALAVVVPVLVVAPFVAWLYQIGDDLGAWVFVVPSAAPLLAWFGEASPLRDRPPAAAFAARLVPVAAACALAIGGALGWGAGDGDDGDDSLDDMYRDMMGARQAVAGRA